MIQLEGYGTHFASIHRAKYGTNISKQSEYHNSLIFTHLSVTLHLSSTIQQLTAKQFSGTLFMSSIGTARGAHSPPFIKTDHSNSIRPLHINVSNKCAFETFNLQSKATTIVHYHKMAWDISREEEMSIGG